MYKEYTADMRAMYTYAQHTLCTTLRACTVHVDTYTCSKQHIDSQTLVRVHIAHIRVLSNGGHS